MEFKEWLQAEMDKREMTPSDLARISKVPQPTIFRILSGETQDPRTNTVKKLERALGVESPPIEEVPAAPGEEFVPVSRVRIKASAGITGWTVEHIHGNGQPVFFRADWLATNGYKASKLYALKVSGASMEPGLHDGDLVVINSADQSPKDGDVFVVNYEGDVVIKRMKRDAGQWFLSSDNADKRHYPDKLCDEHAQLIGRVIYKQSERI